MKDGRTRKEATASCGRKVALWLRVCIVLLSHCPQVTLSPNCRRVTPGGKDKHLNMLGDAAL